MTTNTTMTKDHHEERYKFYDLFTESPYAAALSSQFLRTRCSNCFSIAKSACGKCSSVVYCGRDCQANDWPWHKAECNAFVLRRQKRQRKNDEENDQGKDKEKENAEEERENGGGEKWKGGNYRFVNDADDAEDLIRILGRVLVRKKKDNGRVVLSEGFPTFAKNRCFDDLMSHYEDFDPALMDHIIGHFRRFFNGQKFASPTDVTDVELRQTLGRIMINNFSVSTQPDALGACRSLGVGLYLNASRFDHTCERDAKLTGDFQGVRIRLRYCREPDRDQNEKSNSIEGEAEFNNLTISYGFGSLAWTFLPLLQQRQDCLRADYFFDCRCPRCMDRMDAILAWDASCRECATCRAPLILDGARPARLMRFCKCAAVADDDDRQKSIDQSSKSIVGNHRHHDRSMNIDDSEDDQQQQQQWWMMIDRIASSRCSMAYDKISASDDTPLVVNKKKANNNSKTGDRNAVVIKKKDNQEGCGGWNGEEDPVAMDECERLENEWRSTMDACIAARTAQEAVRAGAPLRPLAARYWHPVYNLRYAQLNETLFAGYRALALSHFMGHWLFADERAPMSTFRFYIPDSDPDPNPDSDPDPNQNQDSEMNHPLRCALTIGELVFQAYKYHLPFYDLSSAGHCVRLGELFELASVLPNGCGLFSSLAVRYYQIALDKWITIGDGAREEWIGLDGLKYRLERARGPEVLILPYLAEEENTTAADEGEGEDEEDEGAAKIAAPKEPKLKID